VVEGETEIDDPWPTNVPPQEPEYHVHAAPVPRLPPDLDKVVLAPEFTGFTLADTEIGVDDVPLAKMVSA